MLSPVLTTRSGSSAASSLTQRILRSWVGIRCRSDRCRTLIGSAPGGSTGTVNRRRVYQRTSIPAAYATQAAPTPATTAAVFSADPVKLISPACHNRGHVQLRDEAAPARRHDHRPEGARRD